MAEVVQETGWRGEIRRARAREGLSRKDAAKRAGVSEGVWRNVETGVQYVAGLGNRPYSTTAQTVARMAAAVRLDPLVVVRAAGLDPDDVRLESVRGDPDAGGDVRIIVVRGDQTTDEVLAEVRRLLDGSDQ